MVMTGNGQEKCSIDDCGCIVVVVNMFKAEFSPHTLHNVFDLGVVQAQLWPATQSNQCAEPES